MNEPKITYVKKPKYIPSDILDRLFAVLNEQRIEGINEGNEAKTLDTEYRIVFYEACKHIKQ